MPVILYYLDVIAQKYRSPSGPDRTPPTPYGDSGYGQGAYGVMSYGGVA